MSARFRTDDDRLHMTRTEWALLALLCGHRGRVVPYDEIAKSLWPDEECTEQLKHCIHVNVHNIRGVLADSGEPGRLATAYGSGYLWVGALPKFYTMRAVRWG